MNDGVREREVLVGDQSLVADEVLGALFVAVLAEHVGSTGEAGESHVDVVGRAAEHPDAVAREPVEGVVTALQVVGATGCEVTDADRLTVLGRRHQAVLGEALLPVEVAGHSGDRSGEAGMGGDVADAFAAEPNIALVSQAGDVLLAGSSAHGGPPRRAGSMDRV